jgi:hypothetical protein
MLNPDQRPLSLHSFTIRALCGAVAGICLGLLSGCQGMATASNRPQVRMIDVSPDAPEIDIYQDTSALAYKLSFGTITSYVPLDAGPSTTMSTISGTRQALTRSRTAFAAGGQYTVLIGNFSDNMQQTVLQDQGKPAAPGRAALRLIHQAIRSGMVDIYLVPAGQTIAETRPVITGSSFGDNTGYLDLPAGTYALVVEPAGAVPLEDSDAMYVGAQVSYPSGSASTLVLSDRPQANREPGMQVIVAPDYVPNSQRER